MHDAIQSEPAQRRSSGIGGIVAVDACGNLEDISDIELDGDDEECAENDEHGEWSLRDEHGVCGPAAMFLARMRSSETMTMHNTDMIVDMTSNMVRGIVQQLKKFSLEQVKKGF